MSALDAVEWEACLLEPVDNPPAERAVRKALGMVPPAMRYFLDSAWWADAAVALGITHAPIFHVPPGLADLVTLVVSQESACRYCFSLTRGMLGVLGFSEARIRRIEEDLAGGELGDGEREALRFARQVARSTPMVTAADAAPLRQAGWNDAAVRELAALAAVNVFYNRAATLPALPYEDAERMFGRPLFRVLGPLLRPFIRTRRARNAPPLSAAERRGPFAAFVNALDGLPLAPRLRTAIDACLRGSALGPRTTALVFAVVARGIGCPLSEAEAIAMLRADGVPAEEIDAALAHLAAPWIGDRERAAAALARDSIWPQPAALQRHARTVRPLFTRQEFVDLIGAAALANTVCRLAVAVDLARSGH
ncbi:carboxymuconolactone decarboxylase family protein [bacterium]|nr:carboxymuconolactone decarboxylase family protein [bacterium]